MKLYTGFGDEGNTALLSGGVVPKDDTRIEAYGTIDELNSFIGLLKDHCNDAKSNETLLLIQNSLFIIGALLATKKDDRKMMTPFDDTIIETLENEIDVMDTKVDPLKNFILPGGSEVVSRCHICRTITRRAERRIVTLINESEQSLTNVLIFVNRLSDYFFMLGRYLAKLNGTEEIKWIPKK